MGDEEVRDSFEGRPWPFPVGRARFVLEALEIGKAFGTKRFGTWSSAQATS